MERTLQGKTASAVTQIVDEIKRMIIDRELRVGDRLPNEAELCRQFGKSRGSIREAVKILEYYGVLDVRQGDGTYLLASPSEGMYDALFFRIMAKGSNFHELMETRQIVETGIINLAIAHCSEEDIRNIERAQRTLESAIQEGIAISELVQMDLDFHLALADAAGNHTLKDVYMNLLNLFSPFIHNSYIPQREAIGYSVVAQHNLIIRALQERDTNLAIYAIRSAMKDWEGLNDLAVRGAELAEANKENYIKQA